MPSVIRHLVLVAGLVLASPVAVWAACTSPAGNAGAVIFSTTAKTMQYCNGTNWVNTGASVPAATQSGCTNPTGAPGAVIYAKPRGVVQFCNGQDWVDTSCAADRSPNGSGCGGKAPGTIQYSSTANELQFCDSTNWVAMGWGCAGSSGGSSGGSCGSGDLGWTNIAGAGNHQWSQIFVTADGSKIYALATDGLYRSTDSGATWSGPIATGGQTFNSLTGNSDGSILYAINDSNKLYKSTNNGTSWSLMTTSHDVSTVSINTTGSLIWIFDSSNYILSYSSNGGASWTTVTKPDPGASRVYTSVSISADGSNAYVAVLNLMTSGSKLFRSTDSGASWTEIYSVPNAYIYLSPISSNGSIISMQVIGLSGSGSTTMLSTNSGTSWASSGLPQDIIIFSMSADGTKMIAGPLEADVLIRPRMSVNSGATWTEQTSLNTTMYVGAISAQGNKFVISEVGASTPLQTSSCP
ncbi:MAG: hypothetical protein DI628_07940 [Blastochloris viridis]|uniref:DUF6242 domain-containing protein n=1 Tax=Blastochloris viridis TaxID=1079 RepID=A0A6N4RC26_BLAVI|nr:MAG: hypothetical protein DI628_07940 [Blastochloris viridis]